jgi:hypothetical protein
LTLVGGSRPDPTYNRINTTFTAPQDSLMPSPCGDGPERLAFVNRDSHRGVTDLYPVVTGNAYCESGEVVPMFREFSEGRIREAKWRQCA